MNQGYRKTVLLVVAIAGAFWINSFRGQEAKDVVAAGNNQPVLLTEALNEIGASYDYFFTLEEAVGTDGQANRIESQRIQRLTRGSGLKQELDELVRLIPNVTYKFDEANPKIVHLIDAKLAQQKGYALDEQIKSINFSGTVFELVGAIAKEGIRVSSAGSMSVTAFSTMDMKTSVDVKGENLSVRKALSDFIPLKGRSNRIIWFARTKLSAEETTFVRFSLDSAAAKEKSKT